MPTLNAFVVQPLPSGRDAPNRFLTLPMIRDGVEAATARVRFLTAEEGGRRAPVNSGYRPQLVIDAPRPRRLEHDCVIDLAPARHRFAHGGTEWLPLGVDDVVLVAPFDPDRARSSLVSGATFSLFEGQKLVGRGRVVKDLERYTADSA